MTQAQRACPVTGLGVYPEQKGGDNMKPKGLFEFQTPWGNAGIAQSWHLYQGDPFDPECPDEWRLKWDLFHQDADGTWAESGSLSAETFCHTPDAGLCEVAWPPA